MRPAADDFVAFYEAARDRCLRTVVTSVGEADAAEDLLAEAFARAWASWPRLRTDPAPQAWIVRTALNLNKSAWRRRRLETRHHRRAADEATAEQPLSDAISQELLVVLRELPARQREVVALRIFLDLDTAQTAALLDIAPGTASAHLARAMKHLRRRLSAPTSMEDSHG
jgi:RNA polymerase sigma factor (sigma-70 family)